MKDVKNTTCEKCYVCTRSQKIWAWIVLGGIFVCGMMAGAFIWEQKNVRMPDSTISVHENVEQFVGQEIAPCRVKEEKLLDMVHPDDHVLNIRIYETLVQIGCDENKEKFNNMLKTERELADAIGYVYGRPVDYVSNKMRPCEQIERQLSDTLRDGGVDSEGHSYNAAVYAKMAEDGCPENSDRYAQLALDELQIADGIKVQERAISDTEMFNTVGTYKKLQMQNEAKKYIKKVEKLVNPGIDFILELQRVIEE